MAMKIFQIGFNRCGTRTIYKYFAANRVRSVHWDNGRLARRIFLNLANGDDLLAGYSSFDVFTDMECLDGTHHFEAYKLFPYFAAQYPDAIFILNTRDREDWIKSRLKHVGGGYAGRYKQYLGIGSDEILTDVWRAEWDRHHRRVMDFFEGKPYRFFICRIETDLPDLLHEKIPEYHLNRTVYRVHGGKEIKSG